MKSACLLIAVLIIQLTSFTQPLVHAHNDYQKPEPLFNALRLRVYSIEADVYLYNHRLLVAHDRNELDRAASLDSLYIRPIIELFRKHQGMISDDSSYAPVLMIDIKEKGGEVIAELIKMLGPNRRIFDRELNPYAVKVVISGDRGEIPSWSSYPAYIFFDGRPRETYDPEILQRVAFISDSYFVYAAQADSTDLRIRRLAEKVHGMGKLLRLWAIPDNPRSWKHLGELGVDIINTDQVKACSDYFHSGI